jgi:hypothetical protein
MNTKTGALVAKLRDGDIRIGKRWHSLTRAKTRSVAAGQDESPLSFTFRSLAGDGRFVRDRARRAQALLHAQETLLTDQGRA